MASPGRAGEMVLGQPVAPGLLEVERAVRQLDRNPRSSPHAPIMRTRPSEWNPGR